MFMFYGKKVSVFLKTPVRVQATNGEWVTVHSWEGYVTSKDYEGCLYLSNDPPSTFNDDSTMHHGSSVAAIPVDNVACVVVRE